MKLTNIIAAFALLCTSLTAGAANSQANVQNRYEHDTFGRITSRTTYAWNGEGWQPALRWTYTYNATGYTCELSSYDSRNHRFREPTTKTVYTCSPDAVAAYVITYTREDASSDYKITDSLLIPYPNK